MKRQRKATRRQRLLVWLMGGALGFLGVWTVPEVIGILSDNAEDTYSEWVWDLPAWGVASVTAAHGLVGVLFVWSAGHFVEGWLSRRDRR